MRSSGSKDNTLSVLLLCHSLEEKKNIKINNIMKSERVCSVAAPYSLLHINTPTCTESLTGIMPLTRNTMAS